MPQGVEAMDTDFPGLVQTSLNMGVVKLNGDGLHITFSIRSSIASRKLMLAQRVRAVAALAGGTVAERGVYTPAGSINGSRSSGTPCWRRIRILPARTAWWRPPTAVWSADC